MAHPPPPPKMPLPYSEVGRQAELLVAILDRADRAATESIKQTAILQRIYMLLEAATQRGRELARD